MTSDGLMSAGGTNSTVITALSLPPKILCAYHLAVATCMLLTPAAKSLLKSYFPIICVSALFVVQYFAKMADIPVPAELKGFHRLSRSTYIYEPTTTAAATSPAGGPDLILLSSWLDAQPRHIAKVRLFTSGVLLFRMHLIRESDT